MSSRRSKLMTKDRISALPDSLLCHILSFLSTKHAVTTSILSKRWRPLWKSILILDVDADDYEDFNSFRNFLNSIIVSRDPTPLRSFNIKCGVFLDFDPLDVNRFVHVAMQRGLEIFDFEWLDIKFYDLVKLVPGVLSCKTLVVLKLTNLIIDEIPQLVNLPLLKTLHLDDISFTSHFVDVINLFNGCPILENLYTSNVELSYNWHESKEEFKGFPNMVRANLMDRSVLNFPLLWLYNAKFMCIEIEVVYGYPIPTFHNLTNLELIFSRGYSWPRLVIKLLQHCPKLQNLMIVQNYIHGDAIEDEDWKEPEVVPECLSSQLRTCSLRSFIGNRCELHFAEYVMLNSKLLYTMKIISGDEVDEKENHQILKILSSYPRGSVTCKLLYESFHEILRG